MEKSGYLKTTKNGKKWILYWNRHKIFEKNVKLGKHVQFGMNFGNML